jgi:energy-converting hydrogenase Eha subunit E
MLSIALTRDLVYSAFALSLILALGTIIAVVWGVARARERRWPWALAVPIAASVLAGWLWLYPSIVIGVTIGGDVGAAIGHPLSPIADATIMAVGIGLGVYLAFTGPIAALTFAIGLAVTTARAASDRPDQTARLRPAQNGRWDIAIERQVMAKVTGAATQVTSSAMRFQANIWARAKRYRLPRAG